MPRVDWQLDATDRGGGGMRLRWPVLSVVSDALEASVEGRMLCIARAFFFFQAEDGIRDVAVTGVQTCALPIFSKRTGTCIPRPQTAPWKHLPAASASLHQLPVWPPALAPRRSLRRSLQSEIGRASCRERV